MIWNDIQKEFKGFEAFFYLDLEYLPIFLKKKKNRSSWLHDKNSENTFKFTLKCS